MRNQNQGKPLYNSIRSPRPPRGFPAHTRSSCRVIRTYHVSKRCLFVSYSGMMYVWSFLVGSGLLGARLRTGRCFVDDRRHPRRLCGTRHRAPGCGPAHQESRTCKTDGERERGREKERVSYPSLFVFSIFCCVWNKKVRRTSGSSVQCRCYVFSNPGLLFRVFRVLYSLHGVRGGAGPWTSEQKGPRIVPVNLAWNDIIFVPTDAIRGCFSEFMGSLQ